MEHIKWTNIVQFHNLRKQENALAEINNGIHGTVYYRGKVKLHGCNAAVVITQDGTVYAQSRKRVLSVTNDHYGFAKWVAAREEYFKTLNCDISGPVVVYGEWCGKGIQKTVAVSKVEKMFAVFAIQTGIPESPNLLVDPTGLETYMQWKQPIPEGVYIIPYLPEKIRIDFGDAVSIAEALNTVNKMVEDVEKCDPFIKELFDVEGVGEGVVFFLANSSWVSREKATRFLFKAKGQKHQDKAEKKAAYIDPEKVKSSQEFAALTVTEKRCEQGLEELGGEATNKIIGQFLKWINKDIKKECEDELEVANLTWKEVGKPITIAARTWILKKISE